MKWWPFFRRRAAEPLGILREQHALLLLAARRCMHDLSHAANDLSMHDQEASRLYRERVGVWRGVFYPDNGPKNYRHELHLEIHRLEGQVARMRALCIDRGIDPCDGEDLPF